MVQAAARFRSSLLMSVKRSVQPKYALMLIILPAARKGALKVAARGIRSPDGSRAEQLSLVTLPPTHGRWPAPQR